MIGVSLIGLALAVGVLLVAAFVLGHDYAVRRAAHSASETTVTMTLRDGRRFRFKATQIDSVEPRDGLSLCSD